MPVFTERLWLKLQRLNKMLLKGVVFNPIKIWTIVTWLPILNNQFWGTEPLQSRGGDNAPSHTNIKFPIATQDTH